MIAFSKGGEYISNKYINDTWCPINRTIEDMQFSTETNGNVFRNAHSKLIYQNNRENICREINYGFAIQVQRDQLEFFYRGNPNDFIKQQASTQSYSKTSSRIVSTVEEWSGNILCYGTWFRLSILQLVKFIRMIRIDISVTQKILIFCSPRPVNNRHKSFVQISAIDNR
ncbi:hypothetical protein Glove_258g37 [Diversispora epigaea]|uniref:Uncharacterized protein n=1 Tax=Diversispora epigaea TaxID=1348612 RepID=A0A397I6S3_9GLOM|nr:hypothetical protein Glove_258g37 [Diversispora epigaea]